MPREEPKHTLSDLHQMQSLPLSAKIRMTKQRIKWWVDEFGEDGVYISFSGGKDSTVLLHMARQEFPNLKAAYADTGLEFPEIKAFVKTYTNVDIIKPKMTFPQVVDKYGFPLISKEVSECVSGARKYLAAVEAEVNAVDRQTDRQRCSLLTNGIGRSTDSLPESENTVRIPVAETHGDRVLFQNSRIRRQSGGGYANKLRKLTGTGAYAKRDRIDEAQMSFATGLSTHNKQLPSSKDVGDSSDRRNGNDGDYP